MPVFVVHEHHARRLHWDFRLEIEGVLKSWAVPKGPSMNPRDRRLAILVDDHPLEYGSFEGIIPEGHYGAGPVVIWDRGEFKLLGGSLKEGKLEFELQGRVLKGRFVLFRLKGKKNEYLLIKKKDEFADENFKIQKALTEERLKALKEALPPCEIKD